MDGDQTPDEMEAAFELDHDRAEPYREPPRDDRGDVGAQIDAARAMGEQAVTDTTTLRRSRRERDPA
jgi:hypothetical protein